MRDTRLPDPILLDETTGQSVNTLSLGSVKLYAAPPMARYVLQARTQALHNAAAILGMTAPDTLRVSSHKDRHLLWQGPYEWLLLDLPAHSQEIETALADALSGHAFSMVDASHRNQGLLLTGKDVERLLATGCMLDLSLDQFPVGMTTRTLFAKTDLTLWRIDAHTFHIEIGRSFVPYLIGLLQEGAKALPA